MVDSAFNSLECDFPLSLFHTPLKASSWLKWCYCEEAIHPLANYSITQHDSKARREVTLEYDSKTNFRKSTLQKTVFEDSGVDCDDEWYIIVC